MKVRVKYRTIDDLPTVQRRLIFNQDALRRIGGDTTFVSIGDEFIVYGMELSEGNLLYYLANPPYEGCLIIVLAALFEISDPSISQYWECRVKDSGIFAIWPHSWFEIPFYHDRLSDGEPELVKDWEEVKRLFSAESMKNTL